MASLVIDTPVIAIELYLYRPIVQRSYLEAVDERSDGVARASAEVRALLGGVHAPDRQLQTALPCVTDVTTQTSSRSKGTRCRTSTSSSTMCAGS